MTDTDISPLEYCVFKNIDCSTAVVDGRLSYTSPHLSQLFENGRGAHILHYDDNRQYLTKPYHIFYCTRAYTRIGNANLAVASLLASWNYEVTALWPGTVVVFKFASNMCTTYEDMDVTDLRNIAAHFARFGQWRR